MNLTSPSVSWKSLDGCLIQTQPPSLHVSQVQTSFPVLCISHFQWSSGYSQNHFSSFALVGQDGHTGDPTVIGWGRSSHFPRRLIPAVPIKISPSRKATCNGPGPSAGRYWPQPSHAIPCAQYCQAWRGRRADRLSWYVWWSSLIANSLMLTHHLRVCPVASSDKAAQCQCLRIGCSTSCPQIQVCSFHHYRPTQGGVASSESPSRLVVQDAAGPVAACSGMHPASGNLEECRHRL